LQASDLRKRSFCPVGSSTLPERTESAAREFGSVAVSVSSHHSDLRRCRAPAMGQVAAGGVCEALGAGFWTLAGREDSEVLPGDLRVGGSAGSAGGYGGRPEWGVVRAGTRKRPALETAQRGPTGMAGAAGRGGSPLTCSRTGFRAHPVPPGAVTAAAQV
jgi:hypothetical protein